MLGAFLIFAGAILFFVDDPPLFKQAETVGIIAAVAGVIILAVQILLARRIMRAARSDFPRTGSWRP